jgi:hypothetical protein
MPNISTISQQFSDKHILDRVPPSSELAVIGPTLVPFATAGLLGFTLSDASITPQYVHFDVQPVDKITELIIVFGEIITALGPGTPFSPVVGAMRRMLWTKIALQRVAVSVASVPLPTSITLPVFNTNIGTLNDTNEIPPTDNTITQTVPGTITPAGAATLVLTPTDVSSITGEAYTWRSQFYFPAWKLPAGMQFFFALGFDGDFTALITVERAFADSSLVKGNSQGSVKRMGGNFA